MSSSEKGHPSNPRSNIPCVGAYDPDKYVLFNTALTVTTDESLTPNRPPCLTQSSIGLYLKPTTMELDEQPPRATVDEIPDAVIDRLVQKDRAFWVDKPGMNAYTLHDAYYRYGMTTDKVIPPHQDVFPRSYQYDLDCVKYRTLHACEASEHSKKKLAPYCRDCTTINAPSISAHPDDESTSKRWKYYPTVTSKLPKEQIQALMKEVGRPFRNEACRWYNKNYPSTKYDCIMRKFSK